MGAVEEETAAHSADSERALSEFIEKMERLGSFQERIEAPPEFRQIWKTFGDELGHVISVNRCALFLVDPESHEFTFYAVDPPGQETVCRREIDRQIDTGIFSWIINRRQPALVPALAFRETNLIVLPLCTARATLGAAMAATPVSDAAITREHMKLLALLAKQCALVMENTELYARLHREHASLMEAQSRAYQSEKMAAMGRLTSGACHEILNPINILSAHLQMLALDSRKTERLARALPVMQEQTRRITRIVQGLLQFSPDKTATLSAVRIEPLVHEAVRRQREAPGRPDIQVARKFDARHAVVAADAERLESAFCCLIENAVEAMPGGGTLTVMTRSCASSEDGQPAVEVVFSDTGSGIDIQDLPRIFDPFFTTRTDRNASGLGLALCYGIVREHGGSIVAEPNKTGGSRFTIRLPAGGLEPSRRKQRLHRAGK